MKSLILFFTKLTLEKKALLLLLTPILFVLLDIKLMLFALAVIIFIDFITGFNKSLHKAGIGLRHIFKSVFWKSLRSKGMRDTWRKSYEYGIGISVFALVESTILKIDPFMVMDRAYTITEFAVIIASLIEVYSIFENMEAVTGRNLLKKMLLFLPGKFSKMFGSEKEEENEIIKPKV